VTASTQSVRQALVAAQIPRERLGRARTGRLDAPELSFYHWILRRFAGGEVPDGAALAVEAERLGVEPDATLATLAYEDLIHTDAAGQVTVAYPFSGRPTAHRVRVDGHEVYAMCAIDALGVAPMLDAPVLIDSRDPVTGDAVHVEVAPDGQASWAPEEAVVVAGSCCAGAAYSGCCQVLNFFAAPANAEQYLKERTDVSGHVISIPEAIEVGRVIFGDVFQEG
jgi:hypothetical protein